MVSWGHKLHPEGPPTQPQKSFARRERHPGGRNFSSHSKTNKARNLGFCLKSSSFKTLELIQKNLHLPLGPHSRLLVSD